MERRFASRPYEDSVRRSGPQANCVTPRCVTHLRSLSGTVRVSDSRPPARACSGPLVGGGGRAWAARRRARRNPNTCRAEPSSGLTPRSRGRRAPGGSRRWRGGLTARKSSGASTAGRPRRAFRVRPAPRARRHPGEVQGGRVASASASERAGVTPPRTSTRAEAGSSSAWSRPGPRSPMRQRGGERHPSSRRQRQRRDGSSRRPSDRRRQRERFA